MVYPNRHPAPRPTLNANSPSPKIQAPDRAKLAAEHLRVSQELIDLGMTLARAATERALADMAAPTPSTPIPCSAAAAIEQAEERARHRTPDYGRLFTHLSRAVRQAILLQAHIADGCAHAPHAATRPAPQDRVSRPNPTPVAAANAQPHRETLHREAAERLEFDLPAGPNGAAAIHTLIKTVASTPSQDAAPASRPAGSAAPKTRNPVRPTRPPTPAPQNRSAIPRTMETDRPPDRRR